MYSSPLIQRLNSCCKELFGEEEVEEVNFRAPGNSSDELLGLEYLYSQSTLSDIPSFTPEELDKEGPSAEEEVTIDMDTDEGFEDVDDEAVQQSPHINPDHIVTTTNTASEDLNPCAVSHMLHIMYIGVHMCMCFTKVHLMAYSNVFPNTCWLLS